MQPVVVAENTVPDRQRPALLQFPAELHTAFAEGLESGINADFGMDSVEPSVALEMISNAGRFLQAERTMLDEETG